MGKNLDLIIIVIETYVFTHQEYKLLLDPIIGKENNTSSTMEKNQDLMFQWMVIEEHHVIYKDDMGICNYKVLVYETFLSRHTLVVFLHKFCDMEYLALR